MYAKKKAYMCGNQVRDICVFCPVIFFERRINLAFENAIADARQVDGVG